MVLKMLTQCAKGFVLILDNIWDLACFKKDFDRAWSAIFSVPDLSYGSTRVGTFVS